MRTPILSQFRMPDDEGMFGAVRKYDIHTGVDLYCEEGSLVSEYEDGIVVAIEDFTGVKANSPWWNELVGQENIPFGAKFG